MTQPALHVVDQRPGADGDAGAGPALAEARRRSGQSLDQVAAATRIRRRHLEALERDDLDALPGPVYARGYLRTYAEHLGLDSGRLLEAARHAPPAPAGRRLSLQALTPARMPHRITLSGPLLGTAGLIAAAGLFAVYAWWEIESARTLAPAAAAAPALQAPPIASPAPLPAAGSTAAPPPAPRGGAAPTQVLVALRAVEETWVTVTVDGKPAYGAFLEPGREATFIGHRIRVSAGKPSLQVSVAGGDYQGLGALNREYSADT